MKTLKRIGLFLWLKIKEITVPLILIILGVGLLFGFIYLLIKYVPLVFFILLFACFLLTIGRDMLILFLDWIQDNWREVKRRIP